jgi:LmbE family N-acetylglucosaminyl deacetylase
VATIIKMNNSRVVLALMPHPDDAELLCAGTLLRLLELGCEVHIATMTPGDKGSKDKSSEEIAKIRRQEGSQAAEVLGAKSYSCLEFRDLEIVFDHEARQRVTEFVRKIDPWLVLTTTPQDYMFDHLITSQLVRDACFNSNLPLYTTSIENPAPATASCPYLYYCDAIGGVDIFGAPCPASCCIDISGQMDKKVVALSCHVSQRGFLADQQKMDDYTETMKGWASNRGAECGVRYAEAFRQHLAQPHPKDDVLSELLK